MYTEVCVTWYQVHVRMHEQNTTNNFLHITKLALNDKVTGTIIYTAHNTNLPHKFYS